MLQVISALGHPVPTILSPLIAIEPVDPTIEVMPAGLILTSAHGVDAARRAGLPKGMTAWCVGDRTAEAARVAGFDPISAKGDSSALIRMILDRRPEGPLLHLHGAHKTGDVVEGLTAAGVSCYGRVGYRQASVPLTQQARFALSADKPLVLPLFSPRTVSILAEQGPFDAPLTVVAISEAVANAAEILRPVRLVLAEQPNGEAMCHATRDAIDAISLASGP
ncbi:uroporphyrinogen-III synthase [Flavimaricola marinus]|uniref:uroporphyrinogen-III synthase n=1 Tax=Flavimaricola marinus TaxID=1819565 RepID=UPI001454E93E|nr:uroporphyrinogen-III synthase [Flavimaricola marinus]